MKKIFFPIMMVAALFFIVALTAQKAQAQVKGYCTGNSVACESAIGAGVNDDCCHCAGNETLTDTDLNGYLDTCLGLAIAKDACHGQYEFVDTTVGGVCNGGADTCCRVPASRTKLDVDPCHGQEAFLQTCVGGVPDGYECCQQSRKIRIHK